MSRGAALKTCAAVGLATFACAAPASAGITQYGELGIAYEQTTTNFVTPPSRAQQSSYNPCDIGDAEGLSLLSGGGWVYDSDPMVTPFEPGQAYFVGLKFRSQVSPKTPESWHEIVDNVSTNNSLGLGELTVCGDVSGVSYQKQKGTIAKKDSGSVKASCPGGKNVLGGGGVVKGPLGKPRLVGSFPIDDGDGNDAPDDGWRAIGYNGTKKERKILAYAICAPVDELDYLTGTAAVFQPRLTATMFCAGGKYAIGGGFRVRNDLAKARVVESRTEPPGSLWRVTADTLSPQQNRVDLYAICHA
jgi:hypothetical protein